MWLKLDLDGILFHFQIKGYKKSSQEWDSEWSKVSFILHSKDWLNYHILNDELLLMCEVENLSANIEALLEGQLQSIKTLECIEPDFSFIFYPKIDLKNEKNTNCPMPDYLTPGEACVDISMDLKIAFWHNGLTANRLVMNFDRTDLEKLLCYLKLIMGERKESDKMVQNFLKKGIFYEGDI